MLTKDLVADLCLHTKHSLLEKDEQAACAVKLVDELVAFLEESRRNYVLNILGCVLDPSLQISDPLVLDIDHVQVVLLLLAEEITATLQLFFAVCDQFSAEVLEGLIEVSPDKDDART